MIDPLDEASLTNLRPYTHVELLNEAGWTVPEIAVELAITQAEVRRQLAALPAVTAAHVSRIESRAVEAAVDGDVGMIRTLLQAHRPERYGERPVIGQLNVINAGEPLTTDQWFALVKQQMASREEAQRRVTVAPPLERPPASGGLGGSGPEPTTVPPALAPPSKTAL